MAEMQIGRSRIEPCLDFQRHTGLGRLFQLLLEFLFQQNFDRSTFNDLHLFRYRHDNPRILNNSRTIFSRTLD